MADLISKIKDDSNTAHAIRAHGIDGPIVDEPLQIPRNLTDEESIVYEKQLDSESIETGLKLF